MTVEDFYMRPHSYISGTVVEIIETGEVFTYFGENAAVYAKMKWLLVEKAKEFPNYALKIVKRTSAKKQEYFDLVDASEEE